MPFKHPLNLHRKKQNKKTATVIIVGFIIVAFVLSSLSILAGIYFWKWDNPTIEKLSKVVPLPIAYIDKHLIWLDDFYIDLNALKKFYSKEYAEDQLPITELKLQTYYKLIEKEIILDFADENNLKATDEEISQQISVISQQSEDQSLDELTQDMFGWSFENFVERVIKYQILANKTNSFILNSQEWQVQPYSQIQDYNQRLASGENFDDLSNYIGWFNEPDISDTILNQLKNTETGEYSDIIETDYGFYIIKVIDTLETSDGTTNYELSQILVKKNDLGTYVETKLKNSRLYKFINI